MRITVLAGGVGGARFLRGVRAAFPGEQLTAVVNTGDDVTLHGLRIGPTWTAACTPSARRTTTSAAGDAPARPGGSRTNWTPTAPSRPGSGSATSTSPPTSSAPGCSTPATRCSQVTAALCERWQPGVQLLPMTDERCETHVVVELDGRRQAIHFQEWWIRHRAALPAQAFVQVGLDDAEPAPGVSRRSPAPTSC